MPPSTATAERNVMLWIAPSEKDTDNAARIFSLSASEGERAGVRCSLSDAADQFRANSGLKSQEYSDGRRQGPILGLIFLRFAEVRFAAQRAQLESPSPLGGERVGVRCDSSHPRPSDGRGAGGEGAPRVSRRGSRVDEPEAENIGAKVNAAMRDGGSAKFELRMSNGSQFDNRNSSFDIPPIPASLDYDAFGRIYERGDEGSPPTYRDVPGLCKAAKLEEIAANGWSLNPGRYVGVAAGEAVSDEDFKEQLDTLNEELETLNIAARELEATIASNVTEILET